MSEGFERLECRIAAQFGRRHCVLTGSGTAALYCAFRYLKDSKPSTRDRVLFPDTTCETAVNAAVFAGFVPEFSDTDPLDYNMTGVPIAELDRGRLSAVVPTHIFGHLMRLDAPQDEIQSLAKSGVAIIEDAAQGYGGMLGDAPAGSFGDASVISFGDGKLLDCGGGGAVLTDNDDLAEACRAVDRALVSKSSVCASERAQVMHKMMEARRALRKDEDTAAHVRAQRQILIEHKSGYLWRCPADVAAEIDRQLPSLEREARRRGELMRRVDDELVNNREIVLPRRTGRPALWRYTFLSTPAARDHWQSQLRQAGITATKLFQPASRKFSEIQPTMSQSRLLCERLLNVQLPAVGEDDQWADSLSRILSQ